MDFGLLYWSTNLVSFCHEKTDIKLTSSVGSTGTPRDNKY